MAAPRKRGAPQLPRARCPSCGKKGLGNRYPDRQTGGSYRQCVYCQEVDRTPPKGDER